MLIKISTISCLLLWHRLLIVISLVQLDDEYPVCHDEYVWLEQENSKYQTKVKSSNELEYDLLVLRYLLLSHNPFVLHVSLRYQSFELFSYVFVRDRIWVTSFVLLMVEFFSFHWNISSSTYLVLQTIEIRERKKRERSNYLLYVVELFDYECFWDVWWFLHGFSLNPHDVHVVLVDEHEEFPLEKKISTRVDFSFQGVNWLTRNNWLSSEGNCEEKYFLMILLKDIAIFFSNRIF